MPETTAQPRKSKTYVFDPQHFQEIETAGCKGREFESNILHLVVVVAGQVSPLIKSYERGNSGQEIFKGEKEDSRKQ